jgi:alcohol dehydrogenase
VRITGAVLEEVGRAGPYAETRPITVGELELAPPGPGEVLVRIEVAGLCHSDLSVVDGSRPRPVPMLLGHEAAGLVVELGPGVSDLAVGRRVVMTFLPRCGTCRACRTDGLVPCTPGSAANTAGVMLTGGSRLRRDGRVVHHHLGVSGFATHAVVDRRSVVALDDDVPADVAAVLGCAVLTGGGALLNVGRPRPGETVAIVGLGGVGMAALLTALGEPDVLVLAVDTLAAKRDRAVELGATRALSPDEAVAEGVTADVVIEAAGSARAFETAVALTGPGGRTITVGLPAPEARASISPLALVAQGRSVIGSYLGSAVPERDIPAFAQRWREGRLPVGELISSRIALTDVNAALDELAAGRAVRQLLVLDGADS